MVGMSVLAASARSEQITQMKPFNLFAISVLCGLIISGIAPHDYFTWSLEVFPAIIALVIIYFTHQTFPLSNLLYCLILIHCLILFIGGHYTYAEVPLFNTLKELLHQQRNNYDKVGHFIQGFVPAIVAREILMRKKVVNKLGWLPFICISICLAISAFYELIEAFVAIVSGDSADAFLGTQGDVWDTQSDMFYALLGAIVSLILLSKIHHKSMEKVLAKNASG
jgi:putative membrane protein